MAKSLQYVFTHHIIIAFLQKVFLWLEIESLYLVNILSSCYMQVNVSETNTAAPAETSNNQGSNVENEDEDEKEDDDAAAPPPRRRPNRREN